MESLSSKNSTILLSSRTETEDGSRLLLFATQLAQATSNVLDKKSQMKYGSNAPNNRLAVLMISVETCLSSLLGEADFLDSRELEI